MYFDIYVRGMCICFVNNKDVRYISWFFYIISSVFINNFIFFKDMFVCVNKMVNI